MTYTYEINLGHIMNLETGKLEPDKIITITEEQFEIIEILADIEINEEMNRVYIINKLRFTVKKWLHANK